VPLPIRSWPLVGMELMPVPPLVMAIEVPFQVPLVIMPRVVRLVEPAQVERVVFSTLASPISDLVGWDQLASVPLDLRKVPLVPIASLLHLAVVPWPVIRSPWATVPVVVSVWVVSSSVCVAEGAEDQLGRPLVRTKICPSVPLASLVRAVPEL